MEKRIRLDILRAELADEEYGRLPGHHLHRKLIAELAQLLARRGEVIENPEAESAITAYARTCSKPACRPIRS